MSHRLFRLWIVLALPIACWTAYEAWDAYQKVDFWNEQLKSWIGHAERQREEGLYMIVDPHEMASDSIRNRTASELRSEVFLGITVFLLTLPLTSYAVARISKWVWNGSRRENPSEKPN